MLNFFKKDKKAEAVKETIEEIIYTPVTGKMMAIEQVNDPVFAGKMMGDGVAFELSDDDVCSPISGTIATVFPTKHAIGLVTLQGLEILIHIGIDTVSLGGNGFTSFVNEGDAVKVGDKLVTVDQSSIKDQNIDLTTMMVLTNGDEYEIQISDLDKVETAKDVVITSIKK